MLFPETNWKKEFIQLFKLPNINIENGLIKEIKYIINNKKYRNSLIGPAYIMYY